MRDGKSVTADWMPVGQTTLYGVQVFEPRWVVKSNGRLVELFRRDWLADARRGLGLPGGPERSTVSAWHAHERTIDRLFVSIGHVRAVL